MQNVDGPKDGQKPFGGLLVCQIVHVRAGVRQRHPPLVSFGLVLDMIKDEAGDCLAE